MQEIFIHDAIGPDDILGGFVSSKDVINALANAGDVRFRINSPGGDVFEARAILSAMRYHAEAGNRVDVRVDSLAASAASIIAMGGQKIEMAQGSFLMIHDPWTMAVGNARDLRQIADVMDMHQRELANEYVERSGIPREDIDLMMAEETWIPADQAVELGLADEVLKGTQAVAAQADKSWYAKWPNSLQVAAGANVFRRRKVTAKRMAGQLQINQAWIRSRLDGLREEGHAV